MKRIVAILILVSAAHAAVAENKYLPVAGVVHGANNTRFRTDVRIFNPSPIETIGVSLHFLPMGIDGSNIPGTSVYVGPGEMVVLNDIVGTFFGYEAPAIGAIRFDSDVAPVSFPFMATSRTYTESPNPAVSGTYGQFIPALDPENAELRTIVLHISQSPDLSRGSRTNAGVMNPNRVPVVINPSLARADGTLIAEGAEFIVPPMSMVQRSVPNMSGTDLPAKSRKAFFTSWHRSRCSHGPLSSTISRAISSSSSE